MVISYGDSAVLSGGTLIFPGLQIPSGRPNSAQSPYAPLLLVTLEFHRPTYVSSVLDSPSLYLSLIVFLVLLRCLFHSFSALFFLVSETRIRLPSIQELSDEEMQDRCQWCLWTCDIQVFMDRRIFSWVLHFFCYIESLKGRSFFLE